MSDFFIFGSKSNQNSQFSTFNFKSSIMTQLLWKPVSDNLSQNIKNYILQNSLTDVYIVDFCLNSNDDSAKYVYMKWKYAKSLWINMIWIFEYSDISYIYDQIEAYNSDPKCLGILLQMPLPDDLKIFQKQILQKININKDIDWLTSWLFGAAALWYSEVLPATAAAVINILKYYKLSYIKGQTILIIWQSNIVGKPLVNACINMWATVISANIYTHKTKLVQYCQIADIIISATGDLQFLNDEYIYTDREQILIDVWFGIKDGKMVGDIDFDKINLTNKIYTPVPWGVWPVTIASLFDNIVKLNTIL